jgi:AraC-like DNA-binding protein
VLSRFVEKVHQQVHAAAEVTPVDRLPDGRTALVFRVFEEGVRGDVSVMGPRTCALYKNTTGITRFVRVQLKPGWSASVLGVAASELTDRIVSLEDLWGRAGRDLSRELLATRTVPELLDRLSRAIAARTESLASFEPASARLARQAVRLLEGDEVRVDSVAGRLGVTARHLRRAFVENVGIGPKDFARTVRLQRAVRLLDGQHSWGRIAADAGYYDQAHLIADFRELVGFTPGAFARRASDRDALASAAE